MQMAAGTGVKTALTLLMVFTLVIEVVMVPLAIGEVTRAHPQTGWIAAPAMAWAVVTIGCAQVVLLHVGAHPTDGSVLDADALPCIIEGLRARGYAFGDLRDMVA